MRTSGDAVIAGAGLFGIDEQRKGAAALDLGLVGNAKHVIGVGRPFDAVCGEVPAIGRLAHTGQNLLEVERFAQRLAGRLNLRLSEIEDACRTLRTRLRHHVLDTLFGGCTQRTAP